MSLTIQPILCNAGYMDNYAYVLTDGETSTAAIVDAAEEQAVVRFCSEHSLAPQYILTTHHHDDHTNANLALKNTLTRKLSVRRRRQKNRRFGHCLA